MKVPMRPIMQALEFHISAVFVNPRNGCASLGFIFGISTWEEENSIILKLNTIVTVSWLITPTGSLAALTVKAVFLIGNIRWFWFHLFSVQIGCWMRKDEEEITDKLPIFVSTVLSHNLSLFLWIKRDQSLPYLFRSLLASGMMTNVDKGWPHVLCFVQHQKISPSPNSVQN